MITYENVYDSFCEAIAEIKGLTVEQIKNDEAFLSNGGIDSIGVVEAFTYLEEKLGIDIDPEQISSWDSISSISRQVLAANMNDEAIK